VKPSALIRDPRVVVSLLTDQQEFQQMQAAAARSAAERAGLGVEVVFAENNAIVQIHQLFKHVHAAEAERPAAIVVETVTGEGLERVARGAVNAGIGWVLISRSVTYLDSLRAQRPDLPIGVVGIDNLEAGRIQGRQLRALLPKGGAALYLQGPADTATATDRLRGAQEVIKGAGIELRVLNGDWTERGGEIIVTNWLRLKTSEGFRPAAVAAQNDSMAVGARRALSAQRPDWRDIALTGCDGLPEGGQRLVRVGELAATIITPTPAGRAVDLVARAFKGERFPVRVDLTPNSFPPETELDKRR